LHLLTSLRNLRLKRLRQGRRQFATLKQFSGEEQIIGSEERFTDAQLVGHRDELSKEERGRGASGEIAKRAGVGYSTAFQYDATQRKGT